MVLVTGGVPLAGGTSSSAELYNPATGIWTATGSLNTARIDHTATLLSNGMVLVAGGYDRTATLASAELYDPATRDLDGHRRVSILARYIHTATLLPNGMVLVAGRRLLATVFSERGTVRPGDWDLDGHWQP